MSLQIPLKRSLTQSYRLAVDPRPGDSVPLPAQTFSLGVNLGNVDQDAVLAYEAWLGAKVDFLQLHGGRTDWTDFLGSIDFLQSLYGNIRPYHWSIPLIVTGATLSAAAAGDYDAHYIAAAQRVLRYSPGAGPIYVRTGWEFNLDTQEWYSGGQQATYIAGSQRFIDCFRGVSPRFRFEWCPNFDRPGEDAELSYWGDDYVDVVSMDFYTDAGATDPAGKWNFYLTADSGGGQGLLWLADFADAHGKPKAISEWAAGADNFGPYINSAAAFFRARNFVWTAWWESNSSYPGMISDGTYPATGTAFQANFGPPVITSTNAADIEDGHEFSLGLTASKPVTWQITGGANKRLFKVNGDSLTAPAQTWVDGGHNLRKVSVRAVDDRRKIASQDFVVTVVEEVTPWTPDLDETLSPTIKAWWDASATDTLTLVSGAVSAWASRVGGFSASQGNATQRPVYSATARNGLPGVTGDGSNDLMVFTPPADFPDGAEPGWLLVVAYVGSSVSFHWAYIFSYGSTSGLQQRSLLRNGDNQIGFEFGSSRYTTVNWALQDRIVVHQVNPAGDNKHRFNIDGADAVVSTAIVAATTLTNGRLFNDLTNNNPWGGTLQELIYGTGPLTDDLQQRLEGYASHKWALTDHLDSDHPYKTVGPAL